MAPPPNPAANPNPNTKPYQVCTLSDGFGGGGTFFPTEYEKGLPVASQDFNSTGVLIRSPSGGCLMYDGATL